MAGVSTYLNFMGKTEEAFNFYKSVFRTEFSGPINYMRDVPPDPNSPPLPENEKGLVMHVALPTLGGHQLMGTDALESMSHELTFGNNISINLEPDSREEADRLFAALSDGGEVTMAMEDMFWGDYFGTVTDKYGVQWMVNFSKPQ
ncbi:MAG: VOC family protein [Actinobacteria bacterium]|nr:VOC family protein [Acidimicrobiia bacterium]MCA1736886.1 VOC family protein [Actinomycetota bacterium]MDQ3499665.1 VOC family protein [Actinomycetota bacterium]